MITLLKRRLPVLDWLPKYDRQRFKGDLAAGITVGVMLIPQGMAYAMLAGLPPIHGLYAAVVPLLIYALLGTSRQLAVGPVAITSMLVAEALMPYANQGVETYILMAGVLALLVGLVQILMGLLRVGFLVNYIHPSVLSGFISASAILIGLSQLKHLLGAKIPSNGGFVEILSATVQNIGTIHWPTLALGFLGIGVILWVRRINKRFPVQLLAVVLGIGLVWAFGLNGLGIKIIGEIPQGLPQPQWPMSSLETMLQLLPMAFAIGVVGFMESISTAKTIQLRHKEDYEVDPNQELLAIGAANIGSGWFRAFPVMGGLSRSAVNDQAGAQTTMASIISAGLMLLTLLFLTPLFFFLPQTMLAAIIMVTVFGLIEWKSALAQYRQKQYFLLGLFMVTALARLFGGVMWGMAAVIVLSLVALRKR